MVNLGILLVLFLKCFTGLLTQVTLGQPFWQIQGEWIAVSSSLYHIVKVCVIVKSKRLVNDFKALLDWILREVEQYLFIPVDVYRNVAHVIDIIFRK